VVFSVRADGQRAGNAFGQHQARQLVRKRHPGKRQPQGACALSDSDEAVRAANDKRQRAARVLGKRLYAPSQLLGVSIIAFDAQRDQQAPLGF
jgi:hypothetical protein